jgi:hypothetical protein
MNCPYRIATLNLGSCLRAGNSNLQDESRPKKNIQKKAGSSMKKICHEDSRTSRKARRVIQNLDYFIPCRRLSQVLFAISAS